MAGVQAAVSLDFDAAVESVSKCVKDCFEKYDMAKCGSHMWEETLRDLRALSNFLDMLHVIGRELGSGKQARCRVLH